jgi:hypothetical protein
MAEQNAQPITPVADPVFDFAAWKAEQDKTELSARKGTPTETTPPAAPATPAAETSKTPPPAKTEPPAAAEGEDEELTLTRAQRRRIRNAEKERDQALGRLAAYEEMAKNGLLKTATADSTPAAPSTPAGPPQRADFETESAFAIAVSRFEAQQAVATSDEKRAQEAAEEQDRLATQAAIAEANAAFENQKAEYPDLDEAIESLKEVPFNANEQGTLLMLIAKSPERAGIAVHWHQNPESLKYIMGLDPEKQISAFQRLEGRIEGQREIKKSLGSKSEQQAPPPAKVAQPAAPPKAKATVAATDAAKAPPSESVKVKSGEGVTGMPSMTLDDGSINPAWKAWQNEKDGLRR